MLRKFWKLLIIALHFCFPDACAPNPCKNSGKCQRDTGKVVCICDDAYTGDKCETGKSYGILCSESLHSSYQDKIK